MYTSEQLSGMKEEELKAAILALQAKMPQVGETPEKPAAVEPTPFEKLSAKIDDLESDSTGLYDAAIEVLKQQQSELLSQAHAAAVKAENEVKEVADEVETGAGKVEEGVEETAESFIDKYGAKIVEGTKIVLLGVIVGKLLGWI